MANDPYRTLGVSATASEQELRAAYRRLALRHHPDRNGGSPESARRFEEVQEAYAEIRRRRALTPRPADDRGSTSDIEQRMAALERELREARAARERAQAQAARASRERAAKAAARAAASASEERPSDEELGYVQTDDSFTKIFDDALSELSRWASEHRPPR